MFQDWGSSNRATVMHFDGSWASLGTPGLTTGAAQYTSLAFSPDGTPYLAFQMQQARCMRFAGGAWAAVGPAALSTGAASYVSVAVSAVGVPYVAFSDAGLSGRATVMALSAGGSAWQPAGAAGFTPARADSLSLVRGAGGAGHGWVGGWLPDRLAGRVPACLAGCLVALPACPAAWLNGEGSPAGGATASLQLSTWPAAGLSRAALQSPASHTHPPATQALDASGAPLLAYADGSVGGGATVSTFQGGAWRPVGGFAGVSAGATAYTGLALAADGTPWLAYSDAFGDKHTVVKQLGWGPQRCVLLVALCICYAACRMVNNKAKMRGTLPSSQPPSPSAAIPATASATIAGTSTAAGTMGASRAPCVDRPRACAALGVQPHQRHTPPALPACGDRGHYFGAVRQHVERCSRQARLTCQLLGRGPRI